MSDSRDMTFLEWPAQGFRGLAVKFHIWASRRDISNPHENNQSRPGDSAAHLLQGCR